MNRRQGFTMLEVIVALSLLAAPILVVMELIRSNVSGAQFNQERLAAHLVMVDLAGLLNGETIEKLKELGDSDREGMNLLLEGRVAGLPDGQRDAYRAQIQDLFGKLSFQYEENVGGLEGMSRLRLVAELSRGATTEMSWFLRPASRIDDRTPPGYTAQDMQ